MFMNNCFIILAGGKSKRFNSNIPKSYHFFEGKPLIQHSIDKAIQSKLFSKVIIVINKNHKKFIKKINTKNIKIIIGGKTRGISAYNAIKSLSKIKISNVLIHDAARPNFSLNLIKNLLKGLKNNKCVVPAIKTNDSVKIKKNSKIFNLDRNNIFLTQTPQAFNFKSLIKKHNIKNSKITDDASLYISAGEKIKIIKGELLNKKITYKSDIKNNNSFRYGLGFDVHRLVPNKKLYLGGIKIPSNLGTLGHSDGDPVLHAVTDAILGACNMGDIGEKFSDNDKKFKNIRSTILLKKIINLTKNNGFLINNIDINIITQKPKIKKYKKKITACIGKLCNVSTSQVNIKGKTTEKLGIIGKEKAIACEAIVSVIKYD